jgi:hypothetical protein
MSKRTLTLNCLEWGYVIGKWSARIFSPTGNVFAVPLDAITGRTPETIERGRYKQTTDGMVTPADMRRYLESLGRKATP